MSNAERVSAYDAAEASVETGGPHIAMPRDPTRCNAQQRSRTLCIVGTLRTYARSPCTTAPGAAPSNHASVQHRRRVHGNNRRRTVRMTATAGDRSVRPSTVSFRYTRRPGAVHMRVAVIGHREVGACWKCRLCARGAASGAFTERGVPPSGSERRAVPQVEATQPSRRPRAAAQQRACRRFDGVVGFAA